MQPESAQRPLDVLTAGGIDVDLVLTVDALPAHDTKVMGQFVGNLPGGPAANFACAASRVGLQVAALAEVGDDAAGQLIIEDFGRYGVDTSLIAVRPGGQTCFTVILIDASGEKAIVVVPTFEPVYAEERVRAALLRARMLYLMPQDQAQFFWLAQLAHACGTEIMIDVEPTVGADRARLAQILAHVDIASFNQFGFSAATGQPPSIEAAQQLLADGPHTVIVTLGAAGALAVTSAGSARCPGFSVPVVDSTGAGDTFNAAFLAARLRGDDLEACLRWGCAAGALAVTGMGPRGMLPTPAQIAALTSRM